MRHLLGMKKALLVKSMTNSAPCLIKDMTVVPLTPHPQARAAGNARAFGKRPLRRFPSGSLLTRKRLPCPLRLYCMLYGILHFKL